MDFGERVCVLCGKEGLRHEMVRERAVANGWRCKDGDCLLPKIKLVAKELTPQQISGLVGALDAANKHTLSRDHNVPDNIMQMPLRPKTQQELDADREIQEEFGFNKPEDGSEERYKKRQLDVPWAAHQFWWFVHNNIAHPLIGVLPIRVFFRFHDYTSRRMHGVSRAR